MMGGRVHFSTEKEKGKAKRAGNGLKRGSHWRVMGENNTKWIPKKKNPKKNPAERGVTAVNGKPQKNREGVQDSIGNLKTSEMGTLLKGV